MWLRCNFCFDDSTGEMTFNDENNLECKPMTMMERLNNPYHFKMTIINKQILKNGSKNK